MPAERSTGAGGVKFRRAHPVYLLLVTFLATGSWWLLAVSQTPLAGPSTFAPAEPDPAAADSRAAALALRAEYEKAQEAASAAHSAADASRRAVAAAQHDWEECLAARAARERYDANIREQQPAKRLPTVNSQYTDALAARQRLLTQLEVLLQRFTREHPDVVALDSRIAAVEEELARTPKFVVDPQAAAVAAEAESQTAGGDSSGSGPSLAGPDRGLPADSRSPAVAAGAASAGAAANRAGADAARLIDPADPAAVDAVQLSWDRAQEDLQRSIRAEQQAVDRVDELRRAGAAQPLSIDPSPSSTGSHAAVSVAAAAGGPADWSLTAALAVLLGAEAVALRLAWTVLALERSAALATIDAVAALLPMPMLAVVPTSRLVAAGPADPEASDATWLVLWLLACEGTLAAMAFLLTALTVRSADFPLQFLHHPIAALGHGMRMLH